MIPRLFGQRSLDQAMVGENIFENRLQHVGPKLPAHWGPTFVSKRQHRLG